MRKNSLWVVGGAVLVFLAGSSFMIFRPTKNANVQALPPVVLGDVYHVGVDPHSDNPVGSLTIILMKQNGVAGNIKIDPTYAELASQTGGSVNAVDPTKLSSKELSDHLFAVMSVDLIKDRGVLFATGTTSTGGKLRLAVYSPDGNLYMGESNDNAGSAYVNIPSPIPGDWKIVVSGVGVYKLHGTVEDDKDFYKVAFVELGGRPGHLGLFPITHTLVPGEKVILNVVSLSKITDLRSYFKNQNAKLIEISQLASYDNSDELYFEGNLPAGSFSVILRWVDTESERQMEREFYPSIIPK